MGFDGHGGDRHREGRGLWRALGGPSVYFPYRQNRSAGDDHHLAGCAPGSERRDGEHASSRAPNPRWVAWYGEAQQRSGGAHRGVQGAQGLGWLVAGLAEVAGGVPDERLVALTL